MASKCSRCTLGKCRSWWCVVYLFMLMPHCSSPWHRNWTTDDSHSNHPVVLLRKYTTVPCVSFFQHKNVLWFAEIAPCRKQWLALILRRSCGFLRVMLCRGLFAGGAFVGRLFTGGICRGHLHVRGLQFLFCEGDDFLGWFGVCSRDRKVSLFPSVFQRENIFLHYRRLLSRRRTK